MDVKDTPVTSNASINTVVTSTPDGPANHTYSKTLTPTDMTPPADVKSTSTSNTDTVKAPHLSLQGQSPPHAEDRSPSANAFQNGYSMVKHLPMKLTLSLILKVFSIKKLWTQIKNFGTSHPQILTFYSTC